MYVSIFFVTVGFELFSLDLIKRRLTEDCIADWILFKEDIFACLERARRLSRTDSQVFEDSIELQSYFIRQRLSRAGYDLLRVSAVDVEDVVLILVVGAVEGRNVCRGKQMTMYEGDELCRGEQPEEETETRSSEDSLRSAVGTEINLQG
ncbi:hypothetical protein L9F63_026749, partial [Diploptera punctata]